ncbi:helix-turn-helix domain-containing protein [Paenibacillus sp. NEAU-GSW1]|uniref:helix-turn-helix domain-containing protein n=1 Tax=Paenibacillus sp. NEAU-GSW1 TaxID=2682486 RepID=UPI0012E11A74|nr:helix-turn-helix transcriptional regulator [Paenibacillus sp. NEAU-GSW1]MUT65528.1 helix-turn-helix domain-containing protein [Paenibacillus sp. NEAU-GSW1]
MTIETAFGELLKELRTGNNLTQEELAFRAELDRTYISMLERGKRQPTLSTIFALSLPLDISPSRLVKLLEDRLNSK